jgi:soluble lytic murein transglycosylase-like protein
VSTEGRRRALLALGSLGLASVAPRVRAGAQVEEPLADSVRNALSALVSNPLRTPPEPVFRSSDEYFAYLRWLREMSARLRKRYADLQQRTDFLKTAWYESKRAGLDTTLVLGLVQVESNFRKYAVSVAGARGYMQVMPFWTRLIGDGDPGALFETRVNLRFGCVILRHYLDRERGDAFMALGRYNGSRGQPQYPNAVFAATRNWDWHDATAPALPASPEPGKPAAKVQGGP